MSNNSQTFGYVPYSNADHIAKNLEPCSGKTADVLLMYQGLREYARVSYHHSGSLVAYLDYQIVRMEKKIEKDAQLKAIADAKRQRSAAIRAKMAERRASGLTRAQLYDHDLGPEKTRQEMLMEMYDFEEEQTTIKDNWF